jgi:hypothetical protein
LTHRVVHMTRWWFIWIFRSLVLAKRDDILVTEAVKRVDDLLFRRKEELEALYVSLSPRNLVLMPLKEAQAAAMLLLYRTSIRTSRRASTGWS